MDRKVLGAELGHLARPTCHPGGRYQAEYRWLTLGRHPRALRVAARVAARAIRARLLGTTLGLGQALAAGLRAGLARADVPVWLDTELTGLEVTAPVFPGHGFPGRGFSGARVSGARVSGARVSGGAGDRGHG